MSTSCGERRSSTSSGCESRRAAHRLEPVGLAAHARVRLDLTGLAVLLAPGAGGAQAVGSHAAAEILEKEGAIGSARGFLTHARLFGPDDPIKPGEYRIDKGMTAGDVLVLLQSGKTVQRLVTIPEGMPSVLVHERLMREKLLTGTIAVQFT